jgi:hypothetical protein
LFYFNNNDNNNDNNNNNNNNNRIVKLKNNYHYFFDPILFSFIFSHIFDSSYWYDDLIDETDETLGSLMLIRF